MRKSGQLIDWNDDRGFGFIRDTEGERYFVHIRSIGRIATRPLIGDHLDFDAGMDAQGRPRALNARIRGANPAPPRAVRSRGLPPAANAQRFDPRPWLASGLLALLFCDLALGLAPLWLGVGYLAMGALSFGLYATDKHYAQTDQWRISETMLHSIDLGFGIIGGLLAQSRFRHKTVKPGFVLLTWCLVGLHALWLGGIAIGRIAPADLVGLLDLFG
ncbi:hypothetical protein FF80_01670 [Devosia sp. LC5]|uniref:DUF1294 domain-containing protein n=1 Tax=Devosia sp. LC5 TaxID=1502724 RepID=UPI0004E3EBFC|nr:DUF1294 domain-containing protein [Devosia sp. LC5]KFC68717.1 hypothetical protein FF80_01670 [Devosia sp. LC5]